MAKPSVEGALTCLQLLTPIARVYLSVISFALQQDRLYVVIALVVLALLACSLVGGYR
jgi:uncharacterized membrane protein